MGKGKRRVWYWLGWLGWLGLFLILVVGGIGLYLRSLVYSPSLIYAPEEKVYFFIPTGSEYESVLYDLDTLGWLKNIKAFDWVAQKKGYPDMVKPGRYELLKGMSNDSLINLLRSGKQAEVELVFNTMRTFEYLAQVISAQLEADSSSLISVFRDTSKIEALGFSPDSWFGMFIPNTYRFFWNTSAEQFLNRMKAEYENFWKGARDARRKEINLSRNEVMALAAIVQSETFKIDEMPRVAGAYMNRIKKGMKLQADPTVIFALNQPDIKRVLRKHLKVDSPYNTYKYAGLPPGPIRIPSLQAIDASLNYEKHDFIYFCAKEDFSGYHSFATRYTDHIRNARRYQKALDQRNIY